MYTVYNVILKYTEVIDMPRKSDPNYQALVKEYRSLAKRADQRLVRLERLSTQKGFENVTKFAYNRAMKDIQYWSGAGASRFNRDIPRNINSLRARINDVKHFLEDTKTSTKRDIMRTFQGRANSINNKYGTSLKWDEIAGFFESKQWETVSRKYGSKTAMKAIGEIQSNEKAIIKAFKRGEQPTIRVSDKKVQSAINNILEDQGLSVFDMA